MSFLKAITFVWVFELFFYVLGAVFGLLFGGLRDEDS